MYERNLAVFSYIHKWTARDVFVGMYERVYIYSFIHTYICMVSRI